MSKCPCWNECFVIVISWLHFRFQGYWMMDFLLFIWQLSPDHVLMHQCIFELLYFFFQYLWIRCNIFCDNKLCCLVSRQHIVFYSFQQIRILLYLLTLLVHEVMAITFWVIHYLNFLLLLVWIALGKLTISCIHFLFFFFLWCQWRRFTHS